jgi:AAA domain
LTISRVTHCEPWRIAAEELPYVSKADMQAFVVDAGALLAREHGYKISGVDAAKENDADAARAGGRDWDDCLNAIRQGTDLHDGIAVLAAKLLTAGMADGAAVNLIRALVGACDAPHDGRWRNRYDDIGRAVNSARAKFSNTAAEPATELFWYSNDQAETARAWLVDELLPEMGTGLASGQWGTYKTFVALDLAAAVMAGISFIEAPVARRGGVLFLAAEGAREIPIRLRAVLKAKYAAIERVPFAWTDNCPRLTDVNAGEALTDLARAAHARMVADFGLPLALIVIDTIGTAAGYAKSGDENDAAINQAIMSRLAALSQTTGALVLGIDHFGKAIETGTRGSSAKEAAADVVLALLGDRNVGGVVSNTHLALRKSRAGPSGAEYPFTVRQVEAAPGRDGEAVTSLVIDWSEVRHPAPGAGDTRWSKSLRLLRAVLMDILASDAASEQRPFADGPIVRAVDLELVRGEFYRRYPADGDSRSKKAARRTAFNRAITRAQDQGLVGIREIGATTFVWLAVLARNA